MKQKISKISGFTLVEMMVIVVIIAVIAAIAVPSLKKAINSANEASAIAALKVISNAEHAKFAAGGAYVSFTTLAAENAVDERFSGVNADGTEAETSSYAYKLTFLTSPEGDRNFILSAKPVSTNALTATGTKRFGTDKRGTIVFDAVNIYTHYETIADLETGSPVGN